MLVGHPGEDLLELEDLVWLKFLANRHSGLYCHLMAESGILSGESIKRAVQDGSITVNPWDPTHVNHEDRVNPASYDLTLGDRIAVYEEVTQYGNVGMWPRNLELPDEWDGAEIRPLEAKRVDGKLVPTALRVDRPNPVREFRIPPSGWLMRPGVGYLAHTVERITTDSYVPVLDGKSSIGRLFVKVHETAGYGDPGFVGQYTLEMTCVHPIWVIPRMRICQIRFHTLVGGHRSYREKGTYREALAEGPVPSQSWKMFPQENA